jgi:hypothetical protein
MAEKKPVLLRIPPDLWDALSRWARDELRSVNGQIEFVLREAVRRRNGMKPPDGGSAQTGGNEK